MSLRRNCTHTFTVKSQWILLPMNSWHVNGSNKHGLKLVTADRSMVCNCLFSVSCFPLQLSNAINLKEIAEKTEGYSGSDLRELCRDAAMYRVRDYVRKEQMRQIAQQLQDCEEEEEKYDSCSGTHKISLALSSLTSLCLTMLLTLNSVWAELCKAFKLFSI